MKQRVEFRFAVGSPAAYVAWLLDGLQRFGSRHGVSRPQDRLDFVKEALQA